MSRAVAATTLVVMTAQPVPQPIGGAATLDDAPGSIRARELTKRFGDVLALDLVRLEIRAGESVAMMGPSGCGKSTLLHCLAGVLPVDSGSVLIDGAELAGTGEALRSRLRRERMGFVFQDGQLLPELTCAENVALPLLLLGVPRARALAAAAPWLARMGLAGVEDRRPTQLSGGQAQRVAIARALVHRPGIVFADEPTGALDQATGHDVMRVLTDATADAGASLVMVTHDAAVAGWCERTVAMRDGRIVQEFSR